MYIKDIVYYNKADNEAELYISDGIYNLICYAYPVKKVSVNQQVKCIYGFLCAEIVKVYNRDYCIIKLPKHFAYALTAEVVSTKRCLVQIGELKIQLDTKIPDDILEGDYISFCVQRLDLD